MSPIQYDPTPNPNSLKFTKSAGTFIERGMESFSTAKAAAGHPLGEPLMAIPGVANVFITPHFLTVTKLAETDWDAILPTIEQILDTRPQDTAETSE